MHKQTDGNDLMLNEVIMPESDKNNDGTTRSFKCRCNSPHGLAFAFVAGLFLAVNGLTIKLVKDADADQIQFMRVSLQYFLLLPLITYRKETIVSGNRKTNILLLARGMLGLLGRLGLVYSIRFLPLGDAISIQYVYVTFVGLFAFLFLKEPCGIFNVVVTLTTLCGLIFISQPSFLFGASYDEVDPGDRVMGIVFAVCAAVLKALAYILVRKMGAKVHYSLSLFYYAWEGLIFLPVFMACRGTLRIPCLSDLFVMLGAGVLALVAQILMTIALQKEQAGPVTVVQTFQIIFAFLFQVIFLGSPMSLYSGIGAALIFVSSAALVLRNMRKDHDNHDR